MSLTARAFLWDLDGTLLETQDVWGAAMREYLSGFGFHLSPEEMLRIIFGRSWLDIYTNFVTRFPSLASIDADTMSAGIRPFYEKYRNPPEHMLIPSSVACLKRLSAVAPCVIVSGSSRSVLQEAVELMKAEEEVAFFLGVEDYARGKPFPDGYLAAAEKLGVPPADCLVFEDAPVGVLAAKRAGMRCVALDNHGVGPEAFHNADLVLPDLSLFR